MKGNVEMTRVTLDDSPTMQLRMANTEPLVSLNKQSLFHPLLNGIAVHQILQPESRLTQPSASPTGSSSQTTPLATVLPLQPHPHPWLTAQPPSHPPAGAPPTASTQMHHITPWMASTENTFQALGPKDQAHASPPFSLFSLLLVLTRRYFPINFQKVEGQKH